MTNFLLITRMPNYLSDKSVSEELANAPDRWPYVLTFDGCHGIGTQATELLLQDDAANLLDRIREKLDQLGSPPAYQLLLDTGGIYLDRGVHKAHSVELLAVDALSIQVESYEVARPVALDKLKATEQAEEAEHPFRTTFSSTHSSSGASPFPARSGDSDAPHPTGAEPMSPANGNTNHGPGRRVEPPYFIIRIPDSQQQARAIEVLTLVPGSRRILPERRWIVDRQQLAALREAGVQFEQITQSRILKDDDAPEEVQS